MTRIRKKRKVVLAAFAIFLLDLAVGFVPINIVDNRVGVAGSSPLLLEPPQEHPYDQQTLLFESLQEPQLCNKKKSPNEETSPHVSLTTDGVQKMELSDETMLYVMMALIFAIGSLSSLDRVAMSVALVPMSEEMNFSDTVKGSISSFFSLGYGFGIVPAGLLLASFSPRLIMAVGILLWSIGTIATPLSAAHENMAFLLGARAMIGASESVVIPTVQRLLSTWVPPGKKSFAVSIVFSGFQTGTILAYSLSPFLIDQFDNWRAIFYIYGGIGLIYLVPWLALAKNAPSGSAATVTETSDSGINDENESSEWWKSGKDILQSAPWKDFAKSKAVWAMFLAHASNNWGLYNNLSWTPTFYAEQYGLNVKESALLLVVPSVAGAIGGLTAGTLADKMIEKTEATSEDDVTLIRKFFQGVALICPGIVLGTLASDIPEQPIVAQSLFAVAVGLQSFNAAGYGAANQEKAGPKWSGLLYSVTSLPSVMVGTFSVYLTGKILDLTEQNWSIVFGLNAIVYVLGATAFILLYNSSQEFD